MIVSIEGVEVFVVTCRDAADEYPIDSVQSLHETMEGAMDEVTRLKNENTVQSHRFDVQKMVIRR